MNDLTAINQQRITIMEKRLRAALNPTLLKFTDDSHLHQGHAGSAGGAGHFSVTIAAEAFNGLNKVACHRLIYEALAGLIPNEVHALVINIVY